VKIARAFMAKVPAYVDSATRSEAENQLGELAARMRPEDFGKATAHLLFLLNQDGEFSEVDRERRRELTFGKQGADGMTPVSGWLDPEAAAYWEAIMAKLAAPGMCNPADQCPQVDDEPTDEHAKSDQRTQTQRNHDAFKTAGRALLASGELGQLNGLPVSVIIRTTLHDLESRAGVGVSGAGTKLPTKDVLRLAGHANLFLAVFDKATGAAMDLFRTRRVASAAQMVPALADLLVCGDHGETVRGEPR